jgi:hypothetical protein
MFKPAPRAQIPTVLIKPFHFSLLPLLKAFPIFGELIFKLHDFFSYCTMARWSFFDFIFPAKGFDFSINSIFNAAEFVFEKNDGVFQFPKHIFYFQMSLYLVGLWVLGKIYYFRVVSVERKLAGDLVLEPNAKVQTAERERGSAVAAS